MMTEEKIRLLYIDDEENNLHSFRATFKKEYDVAIAGTAGEALQLLERETFHLIISDQSMPGKSGLELFEQITPRYPDPIRILMTSYSDIEKVIDAINKGEVYRFIDKPWDYQAVRVAIRNAYEIYRTRQLLKKYNEELIKSYDELDKFVYSVSHDLRAPLTSVLGLVELARHKTKVASDSSDLNYLDMIETSVDKLDIYIRNIIDYYRSTRMESTQEEIDFEEILESSHHELSYYENYQRLSVQLEVHNPENVPFKSDHSRLRVIFNNIVSNAIKFQKPKSNESYLRISADITPENVRLVFKDNGIGIEEKHLAEIFKMFFRASHVNAGSGIGLYIVNEAVKKLEGTIDVQSIPGNRTVFTIFIPNKA